MNCGLSLTKEVWAVECHGRDCRSESAMFSERINEPVIKENMRSAEYYYIIIYKMSKRQNKRARVESKRTNIEKDIK